MSRCWQAPGRVRSVGTRRLEHDEPHPIAVAKGQREVTRQALAPAVRERQATSAPAVCVRAAAVRRRPAVDARRLVAVRVGEQDTTSPPPSRDLGRSRVISGDLG